MVEFILVADDEEKIRTMVCQYLEKMGFRTLAVRDGPEVLKALAEHEPDLVLLDVMMPELDGFAIAKRLWNQTSVPFLFMTARDEEADKVLGLELGADDYITKPFSLRELTARIHAVLRRVQTNQKTGHDIRTEPTHLIKWKDLNLDPMAYTVTQQGKLLDLTAVQFQLLSLFISAPGRVWNRTQILENIRDTSFEGYERTIDVHVKNLRKALNDDVKAPRYIETVRGIGYRLVK